MKGQRMLRPGRVRRGDRGAAAVEFAIVVPVLLLIILGIIEFGLVIRDALSVSSSVRTGVRIGSTAAGAGNCQPVNDPTLCGTGVPATVPLLAQRSADAIQRAGTAMPQDSIDFIWVYRANSSGFPGTATTMEQAMAAGCVTDCVAFRWVDAQDRFRYVPGGSWDSRSINACINDPNAQSLGIIMQATHSFLTGFFRRTLPLTDRSVAKFEPLPANSCAAGVRT